MKKKILLIFIAFFLSGCSANYYLEIDNSVIKEKLTLTNNTNNSEFNEYVNKAMSTFTNINYNPYQNFFETETGEGFKAYDKTLISNGITLETEYSISSFRLGTIINNCFDKINFQMTSSYFSVSTTNEVKCINKFLGADQIKITIKNKYMVEEHNADEKVGKDTYIWYINQNNYLNKPIIMKSSYTNYVDPKSYPEMDYYEDEGETIDDTVSNDDFKDYEDNEISNNDNISNDNYSSDNTSNETKSSEEKSIQAKAQNTIIIIVLGIIALTIGLIILTVYIKYKKNNSLK